MIQRRKAVQIIMGAIPPLSLAATAQTTPPAPISVAQILHQVRATLAKEAVSPIPVWLHRGDSKWARRATVEVRKALSEEGLVIWSESINVHWVGPAVGPLGGRIGSSETIYTPLPKFVLRIAEVGDHPMAGMRVGSSDPLRSQDHEWIWVLGN